MRKSAAIQRATLQIPLYNRRKIVLGYTHTIGNAAKEWEKLRKLKEKKPQKLKEKLGWGKW